jgi:hypothetical protein
MATLYCGPTSTGTGSGANFSNLLALPDTTGFVRGNVYVCIEGSYGSKTLSTAVSGTSTITIRAVDPTLDSGVTGYSSTLHDGQVTFDLIVIHTQRWIINGVRRTETTRLEAPAGYGIRVTDQIKATSIDGDDASFSEFYYLDCGGTWSTNPGSAVCSYSNGAIYFVYTQHDLLFSRCIFHNSGHNGGLAMVHGSEDVIFDHCDFYFGWGKATVATPNSGQQRHTLRYCRFWNAAQLDTCPDVEGGGLTCEIGTYSWVGTTDGNLVYGCIFYSTASGGRNACIQYGEISPGPTATNCKIFNNTFAGFTEDSVVGEIYLHAGSGNEVKNNLFWDTAGSMSITANTVSNNVDASSNPFVDYTNLDFRLAAPIAGTSLDSTYNTDPLGNIRGANGTWSVGAFEFAGSISSTQTGKTRIQKNNSSSLSGKTSIVKYKYVRAGATGTGSGDDWTNAYTELPASLTRDYTYYIADGSYSGYTFDDTVDGTKLITVKKAIVADHGTATGWSDTYGDGTATFTGSLVFKTDYYVVDGITRNENDWQEQVYGFRIIGGGIYSANSFFDVNGNHFICRYIDIGDPIGTTYPTVDDSGFYMVGSVQDITLSRCYIHNVLLSVMLTGVDGVTIEYCYIEQNWSKEAVRGQSQAKNGIIRYCVFKNTTKDAGGAGETGTAPIAIWDGDTIGDFDNWEIYGNIIWNSENINYTGGAILLGGDNGVSSVGVGANNIKIYNNTLVGLDNGPSRILVLSDNGNCQIRNNLWYDCTTTGAGVTGGTGNTVDNNTVASSNPFVNYTAGSSTADLHLSAAIAGATLSSPYNTDMEGTTRGADGTFDIGAYEFEVGGNTTNRNSIAGIAKIAGNLSSSATINGTARITGGSITFSRVQSAANAADPASATFSATPTQGNLLVVVATERGGTTHANFTISGSGWTKRIGRDSEIANTSARRNLAVWTKVAGASEPTNIQVDNGTTNTKRISIHEYSAGTSVTWAFLDSADNDTGTGSTSPLSTTATDSLSAGNLLLISVAVWRNETNSPGSVTWTNASDIVTNAGASNEQTTSVGWFDETSSGTYSDSVSWTGTGHEATAGILAFSATTTDSIKSNQVGITRIQKSFNGNIVGQASIQTTVTKYSSISGKTSIIQITLQKSFPISDVTVGNWITAPLYSKVDESIPDDNDFISSPDAPVNESCEMKLGSITAPSNKTNHLVRYRFRKVLNTHALNFTVGLYQGATLVASQIHTNVQTGWLDGTLTLTTGQIMSITGYSDLRVRLTAST